MAKGIIEDGQNRTGYISGDSDLFDSLRFTYRPMTTVDRSRFARAYTRQKEDDRDKWIARMMKERLVDWNLSNGNGDVLPITIDNLLRVQPKLFNRISAIVLGEEGSDADPDAAEADLIEERKAAEEAAASGETIGEARQRIAEGN